MRKRRQRAKVPPKLFLLRDKFVSVAGTVESVVVETANDPEKIDHVWLTVRAGADGRLGITLNTRSAKSRKAGYDPRVRVAVITSAWTELPAAGVYLSEPLEYGPTEAANPVDFIPYERPALEHLLLAKAKAACFVQGWGEFYVRLHLGIHQIHSRRGSFAHPTEHRGKDGAVAFYFDENRQRELFLFKFTGQP